MKQLLLRVPEELHARLTAQARARGISVNALANQVLGFGIDADALSARDQLRVRIMALGPLRRDPEATGIEEFAEAAGWDEAAWAKRFGTRTLADDLIAYERGHDLP